ncbi:kinase-like protein [Sistotremastrum suecicum HHB10207 ss-3]|uniref:non-specific serine/threonine protein kinase n=1 Tax=Sistotremastrum suecicum HHB10207 ss-3 TaxID=1314776 RepID=A0A166HN94_9AGAM|nr:kinase-like protein [Sistotremastrum suecicum HHB10207 ss-3]
MPFIKRHVTRRLKAAKQDCDKELTKVTNAITSFFEERLREHDSSREPFGHGTTTDDSEVERESRRPTRDPYVYTSRQAHSHSQSHLLDPEQPVDDASSDDGGYEAEPESTRHSRRASVSSSPVSLRRNRTLPNDSARPVQGHSNGDTSPRKTLLPSGSNANLPSSWNNQGGAASRRLSRTIHIAAYPTPSNASSRSTSRSRSPLPPPTSNSSFAESPTARPSRAPNHSPNRRASRILVDNPIDPFMLTLHSIVSLCTDILDMPLSTLTSTPNACLQLVQKVQSIGKAWDEHPDWHGRAWYVQLLLAVAGLSRVVEWWEAEKQFWNFDDEEGLEGEEGAGEPLTFVLRPADEEDDRATATLRNEGDSNKLGLERRDSDGRRSRDEQQKALSPAEEGVPTSGEQAEPGNESVKPEEPAPSAQETLAQDYDLLLQQAERAQNTNIVLELNLDGDKLIWVNDAWWFVVGTEPEDMTDIRISTLIDPANVDLFREANKKLLQDDSQTIEVHFKLRIHSDSSAPLYRSMQGNGMLMYDRFDGTATHTMWVVKPVSEPEPLPLDEGSGLSSDGEIEATADARNNDTVRLRTTGLEPVTPFPFPPSQISTVEILCRICECQIPQWFFEKHNETCHETHKLEADIGECNESIDELRNTIRELSSAIEKRTNPLTDPPLEYRGIPIFSPSPSPSKSSPLQLFRPALVGKMQRLGVKKFQKRLLEQLEEILQVAAEISIPTLKEEESQEPVERQRLLSPTSERKIQTIRTWSKPSAEDPALVKLVADVDTLMKAKLDNVVRMQNTIRYSEKIRQEWEERVASLAAAGTGDEESGESTDGEGERSSAKSDYAYNGEEHEPGSSADPTPLAPSPAPSANNDQADRPFVPIVQPVPATYQGIGSSLTRSSTPSSVSSPLALAAPIIAPSPTRPYFSTELSGGESSTKTIRTRRSTHNILNEPRLVVTPPATPSSAPKEVSLASHRRLSSINPIVSSGGPGLPVSTPLSPRLPSIAPSSRTTPSSIKDFDIIKPISKGAFGSVFLAKKKVTGDYYAIKVLKKSDMIAKNQITNVKAERMILMKQAESPFVVKLYFTFQSKDNLYLVMEYLNGGDCAALIKTIGALPEEWARNYIAEVTLGLEYLHQRGVVHRDLKPDNLLIDEHGHLKLTDFGLSRIGLLGRQARDITGVLRHHTRYSPSSRPPSLDSAYLSSPLLAAENPGGSYFALKTHSAPHVAGTSSLSTSLTDDPGESSGSESLAGGFMFRGLSKPSDSPLQSFATELTTDLRSHSTSGSGTPPGEQKVVGTPDYLAPETILGISVDDRMVDWWALGVITYEFLYGFPPFHADTPEKVFENILSGQIDWHEDYIDFSDEARDFMSRLLEKNPKSRLGANGPQEVKAHPFLAGVDWEKVTSTEAQFIPQITDPESTDYFDPRGAQPQLFQDDEALAETQKGEKVGPALASSTAPVAVVGRDSTLFQANDDFGAFSFKNLPVLKQANDDVIRKLRTDHMAPMVHALSDPAAAHNRRRSLSQRIKKPPSVMTHPDPRNPSTTNPPSPSTSTSSIASSPSRGSVPPSTPGSFIAHSRRPSEFGAVERFKLNQLDPDIRRNSMPSRLRTASVSSAEQGSGSEQWGIPVAGARRPYVVTPESSVDSSDMRRSFSAPERAVTVLIAEDNPISGKILETLLIRMGCRCIVVADGAEAMSVANSDIRFDVIILDLHMPYVDGEAAARYIKSTKSKNTNTPLVAVSAYGTYENATDNNLFVASLSKPVHKADILSVMRTLGFKTTTSAAGEHPVANRAVS